jgi:hypothetical protein
VHFARGHRQQGIPAPGGQRAHQRDGAVPSWASCGSHRTGSPTVVFHLCAGHAPVSGRPPERQRCQPVMRTLVRRLHTGRPSGLGSRKGAYALPIPPPERRCRKCFLPLPSHPTSTGASRPGARDGVPGNEADAGARTPEGRRFAEGRSRRSALFSPLPSSHCHRQAGARGACCRDGVTGVAHVGLERTLDPRAAVLRRLRAYGRGARAARDVARSAAPGGREMAVVL